MTSLDFVVIKSKLQTHRFITILFQHITAWNNQSLAISCENYITELSIRTAFFSIIINKNYYFWKVSYKWAVFSLTFVAELKIDMSFRNIN